MQKQPWTVGNSVGEQLSIGRFESGNKSAERLSMNRKREREKECENKEADPDPSSQATIPRNIHPLSPAFDDDSREREARREATQVG